jgi:hypothetical protein
MRTPTAQEIRMKVASKYKAAAYQRKQLPKPRDNPLNERKSLPASHQRINIQNT